MEIFFYKHKIVNKPFYSLCNNLVKKTDNNTKYTKLIIQTNYNGMQKPLINFEISVERNDWFIMWLFKSIIVLNTFLKRKLKSVFLDVQCDNAVQLWTYSSSTVWVDILDVAPKGRGCGRGWTTRLMSKLRSPHHHSWPNSLTVLAPLCKLLWTWRQTCFSLTYHH